MCHVKWRLINDLDDSDNNDDVKKKHSEEMRINANSKGKVALDDITLTLTPTQTQNQQSATDCRGLVLCKASSHSDQGFAFYHANAVCLNTTDHRR